MVDIGSVEYQWTPGDADKDGKVSFSDLVIVARHYGQINATWAQGDFDGDGKVDFMDLVILARNYGQAVPAAVNAAAVPGVELQPADQWMKFARTIRRRH